MVDARSYDCQLSDMKEHRNLNLVLKGDQKQKCNDTLAYVRLYVTMAVLVVKQELNSPQYFGNPSGGFAQFAPAVHAMHRSVWLYTGAQMR